MQFIKNITSKDRNLSENTILDLLANSNIENFKLLVQKADFIFPFLKERIMKDFVKLVNKNNLETIFEFTKVYSFDFEEMMVKSLLKFADEDLTDRILELFKTGTEEQKAYCAKYFSYIKDPLSIDLLCENYNSKFNPLRINCIQTLKSFNERRLADLAKENIINGADEFQKLNDFEILAVFNEIDFIIRHGLNSPLNSDIVSILLNYNDLYSVKNAASKEDLERILNILIENYPENISLDTVLYYQISDFLKVISNFESNYAKNIILLAKSKFREFRENDIYTYDFDKSIKQEIENISKFLNDLNVKTDDIIFEYDNEKPWQFNLLLDIIREYDIKKFDNELRRIFNRGEIGYDFLARIAEILKLHDKINDIDKNIVEKIENINVKTLILSYLC